MRAPLLLALAAAALLASAGAAAAQTDKARLRVVVSDTLDQPIRGVRVGVNGRPLPAFTDSAGVALVTDIPLGARLVTIQGTGYQQEHALVQFPSAATFQLRVVMTPAPIALDTLRVVGERFALALHQNGFYKRRQQGHGKFLTEDEMNRLAESAPDLAPAFRMVPGFAVEQGTLTSGFSLRSTRGANSLSGYCTPLVRIDGFPADMEQLSAIPPKHVQAIEVYSSSAGAPTEYMTGDAPCGLVLVWLRP